MKECRSANAADKMVFYWSEINAGNLALFGQKCARLARSKRRGVPVPPFFAISQAGVEQILSSRGIPPAIAEEMRGQMARLEEETRRSFSDERNPLITAVRSGDPTAMAGAMFSYLNVGVNQHTLPALIARYGDETALLHMYIDGFVDYAFKVKGKNRDYLADVLHRLSAPKADLKTLRELADKVRSDPIGFPGSTERQLHDAVYAVAASWENFVSRTFAEEMQLDENVLPSVFVQEMVYSNLDDSAFLAFCSRNPITGADELCGDFALGVEGRLMMRAIGPKRYPVQRLGEYFPGVYEELKEQVADVEAMFKRPQDIEAVIEKNQLYFVQIMDAHLTPVARRAITVDLRRIGVLNDEETIPPIPGIGRTRVIKTFKLNQKEALTLIARGKPVYPGAAEGRLVLCVGDAIRLSLRRSEKVVLLLKEPDERALPMLLKREVEGFAATYGSTHDAAAALLSHVPGVMSVAVKTEAENYLIAGGLRIPAGTRVILDGTEGALYLAPAAAEILVEDRPVLITPHNLQGFQMELETRHQYGHLSYEALLEKHAELVQQIGDWKLTVDFERRQDTENIIEYAKLELITHFVHILIFEKARERRLPHHQVYLDVAVADGSLDRVPRLEHKKIAMDKSGDDLILILGTEVAYDHDTIVSSAYTPAEWSKLEALFDDPERGIQVYTKQSKLSRHTQSITTWCLQFPAERLDDVVTELQKIEDEPAGG